MQSIKDLEIKLTALNNMSREELLEQWLKCSASKPYKGIRRASLVRGISYQLQAKAYGGLKPCTSKKLLGIAGTINGQQHVSQKVGRQDLSKSSIKRPPLSKPKVQMDSKLIREWNGRTYEVQVCDTGYILNGITHKSLSACAKTITGAHWSGPRFFGATS